MKSIDQVQLLMTRNASVSTMDADGQPLDQVLRSGAVIDRPVDELIGLIKGVLVNGMVQQRECQY
jgi:hypothetical protein